MIKKESQRKIFLLYQSELTKFLGFNISQQIELNKDEKKVNCFLRNMNALKTTNNVEKTYNKLDFPPMASAIAQGFIEQKLHKNSYDIYIEKITNWYKQITNFAGHNWFKTIEDDLVDAISEEGNRRFSLKEHYAASPECKVTTYLINQINHVIDNVENKKINEEYMLKLMLEGKYITNMHEFVVMQWDGIITTTETENVLTKLKDKTIYVAKAKGFKYKTN